MEYDNFKSILDDFAKKLNILSSPQDRRRGLHLYGEGLEKDISQVRERSDIDLKSALSQLKASNVFQAEQTLSQYGTQTSIADNPKLQKLRNKIFNQEFAKYMAMGKNTKIATTLANQKASEEMQLRRKEINLAKKILSSYQDMCDQVSMEIKNTVEKTIEDLKTARAQEANAALTNGKSNEWVRRGDAIAKSGAALKNVFGEDSLIGRVVGGKLESLGGQIASPEFSGKAGLVQAIGEAVGKAIAKFFDTAANLINIHTQENENELQFLSKELENNAKAAQESLSKGYTDENGNTYEGTEALTIRANALNQYETEMAQAEFTKYVGAQKAQIKAFTDLTGSVYEALRTETQYKYATQQAALNRETAIGDNGSSLSILNEKNAITFQESMRTIEKNMATAEVQRDRQRVKLETAREAEWLKTGGAILGAAAGAVATVFTGGAGAAAIAGGAAAGGVAGQAIAGVWAKWQDAMNESVWTLRQNAAQIDEQAANNRKAFRTETQDAISSIKQSGLEAEKSVRGSAIHTQEEIMLALIALTEELDKLWERAENNANDLGKSLGFVGKQLDEYEKGLFKTQLIVSIFGKTMEDIQKTQEEYATATGRNIQLTTSDFTKSFAMGTFWGDDTINQLNGAMEPFNKSVSDSNEMFFEMNKNVLRMGLNGKKYGKDLVSNLKLAAKYTFKDGVQSLMEMAKWAQNVRFNTGSLGGMLDKVQEGGLEGIIQQSAQLQVLGGNFAMGSDPLAMAYEAFNDGTAYAKRVNGMLAGLGTFNSKTGEVDVLGANRMIANQAAKTLGMSVEDTIAQIKQEVKMTKIKSEVGDKFNEDQLSMLTNKAQFVDGSWKVNIGQKDAMGNDIMTDINEVTPENLQLMMDNSTASLEQTALESMSLLARQEALQRTMQSDQTNMYDFIKEEHEKRLIQQYEEYTKNRDKWHTEVQTNMTKATTAATTLSKYFDSKDPVSIMQTRVKNIEGYTYDMSQAIKKLSTALGEKYNIDSEELTELGDNQLLLKLKRKFQEDFNGDFDKALEALGNTNSAWYTDETFNSIMEALRADPTALLNVKDKDLQNMLKQIIFYWDDSGATQDLELGLDKDKQIEISNLFSDLIELAKSKNKDYGGWNGYKTHDGLISTNGSLSNINDGLVVQNGLATRIDNNDQVLAAKKGGPLDRMLDMVQPRPMKYDSFVSETPYNNGSKSNNSFNNGNSELKISPIQIQITGNFNVNGSSVDFSSQLNNDPKLKEVLWSMISTEVAKKVGNTGKMVDPLYNRIQSIT